MMIEPLERRQLLSSVTGTFAISYGQQQTMSLPSLPPGTTNMHVDVHYEADLVETGRLWMVPGSLFLETVAGAVATSIPGIVPGTLSRNFTILQRSIVSTAFVYYDLAAHPHLSFDDSAVITDPSVWTSGNSVSVLGVVAGTNNFSINATSFGYEDSFSGRLVNYAITVTGDDPPALSPAALEIAPLHGHRGNGFIRATDLLN